MGFIYRGEYRGVSNVQDNFDLYFDMLVNKVCNLFKWENLPETIDERWLMMQLMLSGRVCWFNHKGRIYALNGSWGGEPNVYYRPTQFIVANPVIGGKTLTVVNKDGSNSIDKLTGILMPLTDADYFNDSERGGLYRLIYQTAGLLADNISSLNVSQINGRVSQIWTADNDAMARTVEEVVRDIYEGHPYRVVSQDILNKVNAVPTAQTGQSNTLLNLIEAHRAFLQDFYSELGIGYAGNMKRERINEAEIGLQKGNLDINIFTMKKNLQAAVEKINELFGTDISVDINDEVFYVGSGNANLGETEDLEAQPEDIIEDPVPEEVPVIEEDPVIEELKDKAEDTKENRKEEGDE